VTARPGGALYTPELLALAVSLAERPLDPSLPLVGEARARTCGSTLRFACAVDDAGRIARLGLRVSACAVGQAAAALFARAAVGADADALSRAREAIADWLVGDDAAAPWPGFEALRPARAHPARHGAILLAWDAALAALSNAQVRS